MGKAVVRHALTIAGSEVVSVLGDASYYSQFGFEDAALFGVEASFPTKPGALQLINAESVQPGTLEYSGPFDAV